MVQQAGLLEKEQLTAPAKALLARNNLVLLSPEANAESTSVSINKGHINIQVLRNKYSKAQIPVEKYGSNVKEPHKPNWQSD